MDNPDDSPRHPLAPAAGEQTGASDDAAQLSRVFSPASDLVFITPTDDEVRQAFEAFASEGTSTPLHRPTEDVDVELNDFDIEAVSPRVDRVAWIELAWRRPSAAMTLTVVAAIGISMSSLLMRDAPRKQLEPRADRSARRTEPPPQTPGAMAGALPLPSRRLLIVSPSEAPGSTLTSAVRGVEWARSTASQDVVPGERVLPREIPAPAVARVVQTSLPAERSSQTVFRASGGTAVPIVSPAFIASAPLGSWTVSASVPIEPEPIPILRTPDAPVVALTAAAVAPRNSTSETGAIQVVLGRYRTAFSDLDAGAATAVWPSVDAKALQRAFGRLERQNLTFDNCQIAVKEARAVASCGGTARYVPRAGNRSRHDERLKWEFNLRKVDDAWLIDTVSAR